MNNFITAAKASITISVPAARVWDALTKPEFVRQYLFGTEIVSDWRKGSLIVYKGEWQGKSYEDKGTILEMLKVTHYSPLSGLPDLPENYHVVTYSISEAENRSTISIIQENNRDQAEVDESERNWNTILHGMKTLLER